ncbi:MAG: hypothetical protein Aurels2KO_32250 [Aureliella sp.]
MPATQAPTQCPPQSQVRDYLTGSLDDSLVSSLEAHLSDCAKCEQVATQIECEPDTFVELLQSPPRREKSSFENGEAASDVDSQAQNVAFSSTFSIPAEVGAYKLIAEIGQGGMGAVYRARHQRLDKEVAIKLLPALPARQPEFVARFQREMRAAGKLEHPAIVRTTDAGEHDGVHYLVMDAIDGLDLSRIARVVRQMKVADACEVARQAAVGLAHAHQNGIVHRDIKPSNLMLDSDGTVRILDFGLAQIGLWESGTAEITSVGQLMGTLDYMAPEQAERGGAVDYRADLYSLGATLFRLLSGRPPLAAAPDLTPLEKLRLLSTHSAPKLSTLRDDVPADLTKLLSSLLSRDPSDRPASASHTAELLQPFCESAKLPSLLSDARSRAVESSSRTSQLSLLPQPEHAPPVAPPASRFGVGVWLAASLIAFAAAAIWFTIETGKGQLVIESTDANVNVKLRKDGKVAEELRIEPGTESTRLWSGKYEIEIDSPSDSFSLSTDSFTIRRGETIVATITDKPNTPVAAEAPVADKRLDEVVYKGETLDTWLRKLKYEKNISDVGTSLLAIKALSTPELADLIVPQVLEFLPAGEQESGIPVAVAAITKAVGPKLFQTLAPVLEATASDKLATYENEMLMQSGLSFPNQIDFAPLAKWYVERLEATGSTSGVGRLLGLRRYSALALSYECYQNLLQELNDLEAQTPGMTVKLDRELWFTAANDGRSPLPIPTAKEALKRLIRILNEPGGDDALVCTALQTVRYAIPADAVPSDSRKEIVTLLSELLERWTEEPLGAGGAYEAVADRNYRRGSRKSAITTSCVAALELVEHWKLGPPMQETLQPLYEALRALPISNQSASTRGAVSAIPLAGAASVSSTQDRMIKLAARSFYLSGELLGISDEALDERFAQVLPADRKLLAERALTEIGSESSLERQNGLQLAMRFMNEQDADEATPALVQALAKSQLRSGSQYANDWGTVQGLSLLARVSDGSFPERYVECLELTTDPRRILATELGNVPGLGGYDATAAQPLVDWAQQLFSNPAKPGVLKQDALPMLRSWLTDRAEIIDNEATPGEYQRPSQQMGEEFQRALIDGLETIPELSDELFWLAEPACADTDGSYPRMSKALCEAMARRAVDVLETSDSSQLRCLALIALRSSKRINGLPPEPLIERLAKQFELRLHEFASQPNTVGQFVSITPVVSRWTTFQNHDRANDTLQTLLAVRDLKMTDRLTTALEALHESVVETRADADSFGTSLKHRRSLGEEEQFAIESVLRLTSELLGKEFAEEWEMIKDRIVEARARKARTAEVGDTLAIYIQDLLPMPGLPLPVMQAGTNDPVVGFPIPVNSSGQIVLPVIKPIKVVGKELAEIRKLIAAAYNGVLEEPTITVDMLSKSGNRQELRSLSSPASAGAIK